MVTDFHLFISGNDRIYTVRQEGFAGSREFSSLGEATRHVREQQSGFVVIHDEGGSSANRIPLTFVADGGT